MAAVLSAQIQAVKEFIESHPDLKSYYVYQSQLRILNQDNDEDFNRLIKDVRKINAYVQEGDADVSKASYTRMIDELTKDNFEVYIQAKMEGTLVNLLGRDKGKDSYFVLAVHDQSNFALVEMDGKLDLNYLSALDGIDFNKLQQILLDDNQGEQQIEID
jgi:hypothetical protein